MEAVTPMELILPYLRTMSYAVGDNNEACAAKLEFITEARERARVRTEEYQKRVKRAFDKKVVPRDYHPGDLMLKKVEASGKHVGKLEPNWEGPYRIVCLRGKGAYELEDMEGRNLVRPWNAIHLRKFYV